MILRMGMVRVVNRYMDVPLMMKISILHMVVLVHFQWLMPDQTRMVVNVSFFTFTERSKNKNKKEFCLFGCCLFVVEWKKRKNNR